MGPNGICPMVFAFELKSYRTMPPIDKVSTWVCAGLLGEGPIVLVLRHICQEKKYQQSAGGQDLI